MSDQEPKYGFIYHFFRIILYPWLSRVRSLNPDLAWIQEHQEKGQVIFVGQAASFIDFLVVNEQLRRNGLRPPRFTHGLNPFLVMPFGEAFQLGKARLFKRFEDRRQITVGMVAEKAAEGQDGMVFLKKGPGLFRSSVRFYHGFFGKLAQIEREDERTIYLIPTSVFLTRLRKKNTPRTYRDIFFSSYDISGPLRKLYQLLVNYHKGGTMFSKAIDLRGEIAGRDWKTEEGIEKRIRWALLFHLNNEDRAYRGPNKQSRERKVRKILKERRLTEELEKVAKRQNRSMESVLKEARKNLHDIASDTSERWINALRMLFDFVWARTLEGIDVREEDMARMRELTRKGPVVILPCHRSHVDYLAVNYMFEVHGLNYPRVAAGDNLSKWPLGPVLRRAGAFFLRRSFKGEVIFPLVFEAYIRHVLRERHILVFYTEGGRSRTGKLLHPKIGMLGMLFDAWREGTVEDLPLVPVTIDYGKVFEGKAYLREKSGLPKQKENLVSLFQTRKVLKRKHGVLRMRFGDPIYLSEEVARRGLKKDELGFKTKVPFLHDLGYKVLNDINRHVTMTAGNVLAGLLMGKPRRGMTMSDLKDLFVLSTRYFTKRDVEITYTDEKLDIAVDNALKTFENWEMLVRVEVSGETVVSIPENKRSEIEYYKNNGLHFVLDLALFCMGFRVLKPEQATLANIGEFSRDIYKLLDQEFLEPAGFPKQEGVERAFRAMEVVNALELEGERVRFGDYPIGRQLVLICAHLLQNFLESYFVVAEVACGLTVGEEIDQKSFVKQCMQRASLLHAVGTIRRMESLNAVTFANALKKFSKENYLLMKTPRGERYPVVSIKPDSLDKFNAVKDQLFKWMIRLN